MKDTLVMIMAGGKGSRLGPLTIHRSKPGVPFAGRYRIIDFVLSNFVNSGYRRIYVLTQYMSSSLIKHLSRNWRLSGFGEYIEVVPAQMRLGEFWYRGTADAVYQNLNLVRDARAEHVAVFGGDHIYKMAVDQMEDAAPRARRRPHRRRVPGADRGGERVRHHRRRRARPHRRLRREAEEPARDARPSRLVAGLDGQLHLPPRGARARARRRRRQRRRATTSASDIIPRLVADGARVFVYDFAQNRIPGEPEGVEPYWRDVGTIDSYFTSNMELRARVPALDLYNRQWRIRSAQRDYPPARFVRAGEGQPSCEVDDSLICEGSIIVVGDGARVGARLRLLRPRRRRRSRDSVILSGCDIGARRAAAAACCSTRTARSSRAA